MSEMSYYHLVRGDYIQMGDEYQDTELRRPTWKPIAQEWIGQRWGYNPESGEPVEWAPCRRLVPKHFKKNYSMPGPDLWGEEFELTVEQIREWKKKNPKK